MHNPDTPAALITGASKRIGKALAEAFHQQGYSILVHFNQSERQAKELSEQLNSLRPNSASTVQGDLSSPHEVEDLLKKIHQNTNRLDLLVNNASIFETDDPTRPGNQWEETLNTNTRACFQLCQGLSSLLEKTNGNIINFIDIYAERPLKGHTIYCTSKAASEMLTKSLALEMAPSVRVNGIAPGAILWPEKALDEASKATLLSKVPLEKPGSVQAIVQTAQYLNCCDYLTGQIIKVDGGRSITI